MNFVECFFYTYWDDPMGFLFRFNRVNHSDWLSCVRPALPSWDRALLVWCGIHCTWCWVLFARILFRLFAPVCMGEAGLCFSFLVLSSALVPGECPPHTLCWKVVLLFNFFAEVVCSCYYFFKYANEAVWARSFLCGKLLNYTFSPLVDNRLTQAIFFFLSELWYFVFFKTFGRSIYPVKFTGLKLFMILPYYSFNICTICSDPW